MGRRRMKIRSPPCPPAEPGDVPRVVSRDEWTTARVALLAQEKELTRLRDAISRQRRELPSVRIDKNELYS